ncbi:MAG: LysM peptidoglycan-binding domain-containing protein, partial [Chromatiaceae bacterium]
GAGVDAALVGTVLHGAVLANEEPFLTVRSLVEDKGWLLLNASRDALVFLPDTDAAPLYLLPAFLDQTSAVGEDDSAAEVAELMMANGFVRAQELSEQLNLPLIYDDGANRLLIGAATEQASAQAPRQVVVRAGDTLSAIAARHLGNGVRWRELRKADGSLFTEREARRIQPGDLLLLPAAEAQRADGGSTLALAAFDLDALVAAAAPALRSHARTSIPVILAECLSSGVTELTQIAYVLATSEHESAAGRLMVEIWGPTAAQRRYEGRRDLGNTQPGDGFRFRGRGYVQVTGRANYQTWSNRLSEDLVDDPDRVAQRADIAAQILVQGMRDGSFRPGHHLGRYLGEGRQDFFNAREIVNADKSRIDPGHSRSRGERIAVLARRYLAALG